MQKNEELKVIMKKILKKLRGKKVKNFLKRARYWKYVEKKPIKSKTIMYQAYRPKIMAGNPYALFKELIHDAEYDEYVHYWIYGDDSVLESECCKLYKNHPRVRFVKADSKEHMEALATCEYLVNNASLPSYWMKREDQIYINTWHGTPLKALGKFANDRKTASITNAQRNFFMCDYMVMPNQYTVDRMIESYDIKNMIPGAIIDAGYPRVDLVMNTDKDRIRKALEEKLGEDISDKKIALYAPTFRSVKGNSVDSSNETCLYVEEMIEKMPEDYVVFFKIHNMLAAYFADKENMMKRLIFDEIETNELLSVVDVLITDYSSIFFDYLCTRKPILFFAYDREEYESQHGLYVPLDSMPGAICYTVDDLIDNINAIENGTYDYDEKYQKIFDEFAYNDDGHASKRCVDIIFKHDQKNDKYVQYSKTEKKKLLLQVGRMGTGVRRHMCFAVLNQIDYDKYDVCIAGKNLLQFESEFMEICPDIKVVGFPWSFQRTLFEAIVIKLLGKVPKFMLKKVYQRQFRIMFGPNKFDTIVRIANRNKHWDRMLGVIEADKKVLVTLKKSGVSEKLEAYKDNYDEIHLVARSDDEEYEENIRQLGPKASFVDMEEIIESTKDRKLNVLFFYLICSSKKV